MKNKATAIILASIMSLSLVACGEQNSVPSRNITTTIWYDKNTIQTGVDTLVSTGEKQEGVFSDNFEFESQDIVDIDESIRRYFSDSAYYIQTSTYMFRFQLNEDGKIESYIKYTLEA